MEMNIIRMSVTLIKPNTRLINILSFEKTENAKSKCTATPHLYFLV